MAATAQTAHTSPPRPLTLRPLALALAISIALLTALAPASSPAATVPARGADAFVDSIGVNTHTYYTGTVHYSRFKEWKAKLEDLGVRHIRENLVLNRNDQYQRLNELGAAGIKATLIMGDPTYGTAGLEGLVSIAKSKIRDSLGALEGANEFDLSGRANWRDELAAYHRRLFELAKSDPSLASLPLVGPSIVHWDSMDQLGDISGQLDYGNIHSYPDGYQPESNLNSHFSHSAANSGSKSVMATETGYHTALGWTADHKPASEAAMATYVPRMFLEYFRRGVARTFSYQLLDEATGSDDREDNFGLLRHDLSEKPAFVALRNLIRILEDRGAPAQAGSLDYSVSGAPGDMRQVLLQKRDGSFYLALWRASSTWDPVKKTSLSAPSAQVTVNVAANLAAAERFQPNASAALQASYADPNAALGVAVGPQVTILRLVPAGEPEPAPTPTPEPEPDPELEEAAPLPAPEPEPVSTPQRIPAAPAAPTSPAPQPSVTQSPTAFGNAKARQQRRQRQLRKRKAKRRTARAAVWRQREVRRQRKQRLLQARALH